MANRVFFACKAIGIAPDGSTAPTSIHGVQSVGSTVNFGLEEVFELGKLAIYEINENIPNVELTIEKALDGYCPAYLLATQDASDATLGGRSEAKCAVYIQTFPETADYAGDGAVLSTAFCSGMYPSSLSYAATVDGNATESMTLVCNDRTWIDSSAVTWTPGTDFSGDTPYSGVSRRENVDLSECWIPDDVAGTTFPTTTAKLQSMSFSVDLGREELFQLGQRQPYFRYISWPVEVTTEITILSLSGDLVNAAAEGAIPESHGCGYYNLTESSCRLVLCEGLRVTTSGNKISSVSTTGGDTGGGNEEVTYTFTNYNYLTVEHKRDANTSLRW